MTSTTVEGISLRYYLAARFLPIASLTLLTCDVISVVFAIRGRFGTYNLAVVVCLAAISLWLMLLAIVLLLTKNPPRPD